MEKTEILDRPALVAFLNEQGCSVLNDKNGNLVVVLPDRLLPPIAIVLVCPFCKQQHVDEGEWETRVHRTHQCVASSFGPGCGHQWRPSNRATRGVAYDYPRDENKNRP
jgi:hypothetical protein